MKASKSDAGLPNGRLRHRPVNIYVGASLLAKLFAQDAARMLESFGFKITSRWHDHKGYGPTPHDTPEIIQEWGQTWSQNDTDDMTKADTLVLLTDVLSSSGGLWVELGFFLAQPDKNIILVGSQTNVFCRHPRVLHVETSQTRKVSTLKRMIRLSEWMRESELQD